jgi:hypothetical protein
VGKAESFRDGMGITESFGGEVGKIESLGDEVGKIESFGDEVGRSLISEVICSLLDAFGRTSLLASFLIRRKLGDFAETFFDVLFDEQKFFKICLCGEDLYHGSKKRLAHLRC